MYGLARNHRNPVSPESVNMDTKRSPVAKHRQPPAPASEGSPKLSRLRAQAQTDDTTNSVVVTLYLRGEKESDHPHDSSLLESESSHHTIVFNMVKCFRNGNPDNY